MKTAYDENYDTVILGAFGCGAFYNPPELVAEFYKRVIDTHFKGAFRKITFAILDDGFKGNTILKVTWNHFKNAGGL